MCTYIIPSSTVIVMPDTEGINTIPVSLWFVCSLHVVGGTLLCQRTFYIPLVSFLLWGSAHEFSFTTHKISTHGHPFPISPGQRRQISPLQFGCWNLCWHETRSSSINSSNTITPIRCSSSIPLSSQSSENTHTHTELTLTNRGRAAPQQAKCFILDPRPPYSPNPSSNYCISQDTRLAMSQLPPVSHHTLKFSNYSLHHSSWPRSSMHE